MFQNVSSFNFEFCINCQDTREVLGHSSIDCPEVICKKCFVKGHMAVKCPKSMTSSNMSKQESIKPKRCKLRKISSLDMSLEVCSYCRQFRDSEEKLSKHMQECKFYIKFIQPSATGFLCRFCESFYEDIWNIIEHLKENHATKIDFYVKKFNNQVKQFFRIDHSNRTGPKSKSRKYLCNICPVEKWDLSKIIVHLKSVHPETNRIMSIEYFIESLSKTSGFSNSFAADYETEDEEPKKKKAKVYQKLFN